MRRLSIAESLREGIAEEMRAGCVGLLPGRGHRRLRRLGRRVHGHAGPGGRVPRKDAQYADRRAGLLRRGGRGGDHGDAADRRRPVRRLPVPGDGPDRQQCRQAAIHVRRHDRGPDGDARSVGATGRGSQHAQNMERYFTGVPGIKVVAVSNAYDAKGILKSAVRDDNPVLIFEHKLLYGSKGARAEPGAVDATSDVPEGDYTVPLDRAAVRRKGRDVTILAWLLMAHFAVQAAERLAAEGIDAEVIDVRSLSPIDYETIGESVAEDRAGRDRRGGPEDGWRWRRDRRGYHGAVRRKPPDAGRPRRVGRRAGPVHARARKRLPARCSADRRWSAEDWDLVTSRFRKAASSSILVFACHALRQ